MANVQESGRFRTDVDYDFVIIGSGFGGSISALRLAEKGYRVLVLEKGKRFSADDYAKTNWNVKRWLWLPYIGFHGIFKITFFRHLGVLSGVGVGGGSLVYANTLPVPKTEFFSSASWAHLADWHTELTPFYATAQRMLGATANPKLETGDLVLQQLARELGREEHFEATNVAVYFGEPEVTVPDPYFDGKGPERTGCRFCGGCMVGCRYNSKNTLDKNYLYFAERAGVTVRPRAEVYDVIPLDQQHGATGYRIKWRSSATLRSETGSFTTNAVIFSGGVLGSVGLLLKLKESSLPYLSDKIGNGIRTNSESLIGITTYDRTKVFSDGIAIGSIMHTDDHSHLEPVRYPAGSGFWRLLLSPMVYGRTIWQRLAKIVADFFHHPINNLRIYTVDDWAKRTQILLYMRTIDSTLRFRRSRLGMKTTQEQGSAPTAFVPEVQQLATRYAEIVDAKPTVLLTESLLGIPTTAHILGGCIMGRDASDGVIDTNHRVFGYDNMYVCDGSTISANPGVNPSLTIAALTERAMSLIPDKRV